MQRLLSTLAIAFALAAASFAPRAGAATKLVFLHNASAAFVGLYVAEDQGYLAKRGIDMEFDLAQSGAVMPPALLSGSAQIGAPTSTVLIQAVQQGIDLVAIAGTTVYPTPAGQEGVVARGGTGIKTPKDLEGHKVGLPSLGGIFEVLMRNWVRADGGDDRKVQWVEVSIRQMADALKSGLVDAVVPVEPFYSRVLATKAGYDIGDFQKGVPAGTSPVMYVTTRAWAKAHPDLIKSVRAALDEAIVYIENPANASAVRASIAKYTKLPPAVAATLTMPANFAPHMKPQALAFWVDAMLKQGLIAKRIDPASLILP